MLDAINASQMAMNVDQLKLQTISQNVANMNTPGFKRQLLESLTFEEQSQAQMDPLLNQLQSSQNKTQGTFSQTNNPNDLAIAGEGYFQVQNEQGTFYTRRGDFQINNQGELATATGDSVMGKGGVLRINDNAFTVNAQGQLLIDHHPVDLLQVVQFKDPHSLRYVGNGLYESDESPTPIDSKTRVLQGVIEQSNVKSIDEMMGLVSISRHFEASQRVMRTADDLLATAINQLGEGNV